MKYTLIKHFIIDPNESKNSQLNPMRKLTFQMYQILSLRYKAQEVEAIQKIDGECLPFLI